MVVIFYQIFFSSNFVKKSFEICFTKLSISYWFNETGTYTPVVQKLQYMYNDFPESQETENISFFVKG